MRHTSAGGIPFGEPLPTRARWTDFLAQVAVPQRPNPGSVETPRTYEGSSEVAGRGTAWASCSKEANAEPSGVLEVGTECNYSQEALGSVWSRNGKTSSRVAPSFALSPTSSF